LTNAATLEVLCDLLLGPSIQPGERSVRSERVDDEGSTAPPDWRFIEAFLVHHGLAGTAVVRQRRAVAAGEPAPLPARLRAAFEPSYVRTAVESGVRLETVERARRALAGTGIPSLAFKGAALLVDGTYRDPGERMLEDVDILVAPHDADGAVATLTGAGFAPWTPWDPARKEWVSAFTLDDGSAPAGVVSTVDLHWSSMYGTLRLTAPMERDPLWDGADLDAGLPTTEAHFVVLADHFLKHVRVVHHLRGLADLCRLGPRLIDLDALRRHARRRGSGRRLATIVRVLADLYGVRFAEDVRSALGASAPPGRAERRYLGPERLLGSLADAPGRLSGLLLRWRLGGGASAALRDVAHVAAPRAAWLRARYPDAEGPVLGLRVRFAAALARWLVGRGPSPLAPNQDPPDPPPGPPPGP
jgi:hypothetical protein